MPFFFSTTSKYGSWPMPPRLLQPFGKNTTHPSGSSDRSQSPIFGSQWTPTRIIKSSLAIHNGKLTQVPSVLHVKPALCSLANTSAQFQLFTTSFLVIDPQKNHGTILPTSLTHVDWLCITSACAERIHKSPIAYVGLCPHAALPSCQDWGKQDTHDLYGIYQVYPLPRTKLSIVPSE